SDLNKRFAQEARAAIRLRHPNVIQIFDFSLEGGTAYIVMEYIRGTDLQQVIGRRRLPSLPLALEIARQSLRALGFLHQNGFVHRDISPDNLMLCCDYDGNPLVKMIDLGIAKSLESSQDLTASGTFMGKLRYSSPEHFGSQGTAGVEARSDLYSFGVVLYEFLTGRYPIRGDGDSQIIAGHLFHQPLEFAESDPHDRIPDELRSAVLKALDKDPERRFPVAAEFAARLERLQACFPLTAETVEESRRLTIPDAGGGEPVDPPGSTQNRLDQNFGLDTTPRPELRLAPTQPALSGSEVAPEMPTMAMPVAGDEPGNREEQISALLTGAEVLCDLGHAEQARLQLNAILRLRPDHPKALRLLQALPEDEGELGSAAASKEEDSAFDRFVETACRLAEEHNYASAIHHLEGALDLQAENRTVRQMLAEAQENLRQQEEDRRLRIDSEVFQLRKLLAAGDLPQARERLLSARRAYGSAEGLREVSSEIRQAGAIERTQRIEEILEDSRQHAAQSDFAAAAQALERARDLVEGDRELLPRIEEVKAELETRKRRVAELAEAIRRVEELIAEGRLIEADRALFQTRESHGRQQRLTQLREQLDELHHREYEAQVRSLLEEAESLAAQGELARALQILHKAQTVAPADSELRRGLQQREQDWRRTLAEQGRDQEIDEIEARIRELIAEHNLEEAQAELTAAEARFGTFETFDVFRRLITEGFQERANALIREAGIAFEAERYEAAIGLMRQALDLDPANPWIRHRLDEAEANLRREKERRTTVSEIETLIETDELDAAHRRLGDAVAKWGAGEDFDEIQLQLAARRLLKRRDRVRSLVEQAGQARQAEDFLKARLLLAQALELEPHDADARSLAKILDAGE
ncbi:MAG: protein kinase, partial [bacterium]|nr:protein kinase [bacterium]